MSTKFIKKKLLIVEGKDDAKFFNALCEFLGVTDYQTKQTEGISNYSAKIAVIKKTPGFKSNVSSIGIVRDADKNFGGSFQSVQRALENSDLPVPDEPLMPVIDHVEGLRVNVFIMPDNESQGMLEDLLLRSVNENPTMPCVDQYFTCLNGIDINPKNMSKARTQTYLAAQIECAMSIGVAASKGYWPFSQEDFGDISNFLKEL